MQRLSRCPFFGTNPWSLARVGNLHPALWTLNQQKRICQVMGMNQSPRYPGQSHLYGVFSNRVLGKTPWRGQMLTVSTAPQSLGHYLLECFPYEAGIPGMDYHVSNIWKYLCLILDGTWNGLWNLMTSCAYLSAVDIPMDPNIWTSRSCSCVAVHPEESLETRWDLMGPDETFDFFWLLFSDCKDMKDIWRIW